MTPSLQEQNWASVIWHTNKKNSLSAEELAVDLRKFRESQSVELQGGHFSGTWGKPGGANWRAAESLCPSRRDVGASWLSHSGAKDLPNQNTTNSTTVCPAQTSIGFQLRLGHPRGQGRNKSSVLALDTFCSVSSMEGNEPQLQTDHKEQLWSNS